MLGVFIAGDWGPPGDPGRADGGAFYSSGQRACVDVEGGSFTSLSSGPGWSGGFRKLYQERSAGRTTEAIVVWKSATETAAWKTLMAISCRVCFPSTRIRFVGPSGDDGPGPTFSPARFYVGERPARFEREFAGIGAVWVVPRIAIIEGIKGHDNK